MISHKHKCIFIHIPKCGGMSIEELIWPDGLVRTEQDLWWGFIDAISNKYQTDGLQHLKAFQIRQEVGEVIFNSYFKFAIIRNPWDKVISQYTYIKNRPDLLNYLSMSKDDSLEVYLNLIQQRDHIQWTLQYPFVMDETEVQLVDYIGRFETFTEDVFRVLKILGLNNIKTIPHINKGNRSNYKEYFTTTTKKLVSKIYAKDIEIFKYTYK